MGIVPLNPENRDLGPRRRPTKKKRRLTATFWLTVLRVTLPNPRFAPDKPKLASDPDEHRLVTDRA